MGSYLKVSSGVLKRIRTEAKRLAEIEYRSNRTKNKSAFVSRHTGRHYERLLKIYYEEAERRRMELDTLNANLKVDIARLRRLICNLQNDIEFQGLLGKLEGNPRNGESATVLSK